MNYVVADVKTRRKSYTDMRHGDDESVSRVNERMLTVEQYNILARRIIGKWAPAQIKGAMLSSEDAIDFVSHRIMMGDWGYDENKSNLKTCRGYCGKRAILAYIRTLSSQRNMVTNFMDTNETESGAYAFLEDPKSPSPQEQVVAREQRQEDRRKLQKMMADLNDTQYSCVTMFFMEDMRISDIARQLHMTREGVSKSLKEAMKTMRITNKRNGP